MRLTCCFCRHRFASFCYRSQAALAQQADFGEDVSTLTTMISEAQQKLQEADQPDASASLETLQQQLSEHKVSFLAMPGLNSLNPFSFPVTERTQCWFEGNICVSVF